MNPQPRPELTRCPHDGYLLNGRGVCWYCGRKAELVTVAPMAARKRKAQVEREV